MNLAERSLAYVSEFHEDYILVVTDDTEDDEDAIYAWVSDAAFGRKVLALIEETVNKMEHHAAKQAERDKRAEEAEDEEDDK